MSTPPHPSGLILPGQSPPPPATQQLHVTNSSGAVQRTVTVTTRTDPGFFRKLIAQLNPLRQSTRTGLAMSGLGTAALALEVAATLNLGNPFLYSDRRDTWKELSGLLEGNRNDIWRAYFDNIPPNWDGRAVELLQQYIRFNINGLYSQLGKITGEMSTTMHGQYKQVMQYDLSVFALYATTAPMLKALAAMSGHPMGRVALITQTGLFLTAVGNLLKQFSDIYNSYEGDLNKLELQLNDLRGTFYKGGDPSRGPRDLNLAPGLADPASVDTYWQRPGEDK